MLQGIGETPFENLILCFATGRKIGTLQKVKTPQDVNDTRMPSPVQQSQERESDSIARNVLGFLMSIVLC